ncbi:MAG: YitT family protein [Rikenellaceae bacterium]
MLKFITKEKAFSREWFLSWVGIIVGSFLVAASFALFISPYKIVPGGVYGTGIILNHFFPDIKVGTFGLCLDVPLLLISLRIFGATFGAKTVVSALITPIFMNIIATYAGEAPAEIFGGNMDLSDDVLVAALFGGAILGAGLGIIFKNKATSGGTDIIAMIITKFAHLQLGKSIIIVESMVIIAGIIAFGDWKLPLYAMVTLFVSIKMIDSIIEGPSNDKLLFIVSEKHEEIREYIIKDMDRGGTYIKSNGMFTGAEKNMIFLVVPRRELALVESYIKSVDKNVFMVIINAHETLGDGFRSIANK